MCGPDGEGLMPKTSRSRREGVERDGVPSPLGVGSGEGAVFLIFNLKRSALVHPERHFCQEMLAGYSDYNTMFADQADIVKLK